MKGRSIQDNLHLVRDILEGLKDDTEAALINLDQCKDFNRVDNQFLLTGLETAGLKLEFRKLISMLYYNLHAVVQLNEKHSEAFAIEESVWQGCPLSPLLYVLPLELQLRRLKDEEPNPALRGVPFAGWVSAKVSAYADDITVFVSRRLDILAGKKAVERYEEVVDDKINFGLGT